MISANDSQEIRFSSFGIHIAVCAPPHLLDRVREALPPGTKVSTRRVVDRSYEILTVDSTSAHQSDERFILQADSVKVSGTKTLADLIHDFESDSRIFIGEMTVQKVILHAGVVGWRDKAILFPGSSWSGKSTLVAALVKSGATYFSDEYAVLDRDGRVHPYPKPLSIRNGGTGIARSYSAKEIGAVTGRRSLPVGLVVVTKYRPDGIWQPVSIPASEGLMALSENSISIRRSPQLVLETLKRVVLDADIISGTRGEAQQVVDYVRLNVPKTWRGSVANGEGPLTRK